MNSNFVSVIILTSDASDNIGNVRRPYKIRHIREDALKLEAPTEKIS